VDVFRVSVITGRPTILMLAGELDVAGVDQLLGAVQACGRDIELDCSGLEFIDAAGVGAFVRAHHLCAERGGHLAVRNPSRLTQRVLSLVQLDAFFDVPVNARCR